MDTLNSILIEAEKQFKLGKYKKAAQLYQQIIRLDSQNALAHAQLARCLNRLGQTQQAEIEAQLALDLNPTLAVAHLALSNVYLSRQQYQDAEKEDRLALQLDSRLADGYIALGANFMMRERYDESIAALEQAHVLEPRDYLVYYNLSLVCSYSKSWEKAKENAWRAFRLHPSHQTLVLIWRVIFSAHPQLGWVIFLPWLLLIFLSAQSNSIYFALGVNIIATIFIALVFFAFLKPRRLWEILLYGTILVVYTLFAVVPILQMLNIKPNDVELEINKISRQDYGSIHFLKLFPLDAYSGKAKSLSINFRVKNKLQSDVYLKCYLRGALGHTYETTTASRAFPPGESLADLQAEILSVDRDLALRCGDRFYEFAIFVPTDD